MNNSLHSPRIVDTSLSPVHSSLITRTVVVCAALAGIGFADEAWKKKKVSDWTEDDAQAVLTNSPWAGVTSPEYASSNGNRGGSRRGGRLGGISVGIPGVGIGGGRSGPGGGGYPRNDPRDERERGAMRDVTVRWESAKPVQEAQLKAKHTDAPTVDEKYYGIVIVGISARMASENGRPKAEIKVDGGKAIKSADVKLLSREEGNMILFLFPRSAEITLKNQRVEFDTQIGTMRIRYSFYPADMQWDNNLEL